MQDLSKLFASVDVSKVEEIVLDLIQAAPAIEAGVASAAPFVEALVTLIGHGGAPSDAEWAALRARLDAGTSALDNAAAEAQAEIQQEANVAPEADAAPPGSTTISTPVVAEALAQSVDSIVVPEVKTSAPPTK